eukprot:1568021-Pleurochrysis_carterae.AAC.1
MRGRETTKRNNTLTARGRRRREIMQGVKEEACPRMCVFAYLRRKLEKIRGKKIRGTKIRGTKIRGKEIRGGETEGKKSEGEGSEGRRSESKGSEGR